MNKILLVLQREYLTRVRKKTFLLMTFLSPLLFASLFIAPILLLGLQSEKIVEVVDESGQIASKLQGNDKLSYVVSNYKNLKEAKEKLPESKYYAILYIPKIELENPKGIEVHAEKSISLEIEVAIKDQVNNIIEDIRLMDSGIDKKVLESIKTNISLDTKRLTGEKSSSALASIVGTVVAILIYFAVFLYGQQVMRGVIEEKSSKIIEVIISSLKPFELMMGKILGVGLVGLTQFLLWGILTFGIIQGASLVLDLEQLGKAQVEANVGKTQENQLKDLTENPSKLNKVFAGVSSLPVTKIIIAFLLYFLGGYLLYSSLFAAVASGVDNEADTQQFVLPVSAPLIIAIMAFQVILRDPDGGLAFWLSMIPFTSPVAMMARLPFGGVPEWQLIVSVLLLIITFIGVTWVAGRIYRIGILMYGKKPTFKDLGKWIFYKL